MKHLCGVGIVLLVLGAALAEEPDVELKVGAYNSSAVCGVCHEDIFRSWSHSMHSSAYSDPIFQTSYMQAYLETGGKAGEICLTCHAPVAAATGDLLLENVVSSEGVTCDFCHSVDSVHLDRPPSRFEVKLDGTKRGPLADAESPVHQVAKSELHKSAEFCAGCHEWTNSHGVSVLSTYTEWRASKHRAEGRTCQSCHMPVTSGVTVRSDLGVEKRAINLHNISGMHSTEQVQKAATAKILRVRRKNENVGIVKVEVANVGSGHAIPTGLPTRKLILEVELYNDGRLIERFERVYQKKVVDSKGRLIVQDHKAMMDAVDIREDNRLQPGERREERFVTTVPRTGELRAEMRLRYSYTPQLLSPQAISIDMAEERVP